MDPLTTAVVTILGKYAIDKGASLLKEAGKGVAEAAGRLFDKVMQRLKADPAEAKNAERFETNPQGYQQPVADAVEDKMKSDPAFAAELKALLEELKRAESAAGIVISGVSGDVIIGDNAFKTGDVYGTVTYGGSQQTTINRSGGTDVDAPGGQVTIEGDVVGRDKKTK